MRFPNLRNLSAPCAVFLPSQPWRPPKLHGVIMSPRHEVKCIVGIPVAMQSVRSSSLRKSPNLRFRYLLVFNLWAAFIASDVIDLSGLGWKTKTPSDRRKSLWVVPLDAALAVVLKLWHCHNVGGCSWCNSAMQNYNSKNFKSMAGRERNLIQDWQRNQRWTCHQIIWRRPHKKQQRDRTAGLRFGYLSQLHNRPTDIVSTQIKDWEQGVADYEYFVVSNWNPAQFNQQNHIETIVLSPSNPRHVSSRTGIRTNLLPLCDNMKAF